VTLLTRSLALSVAVLVAAPAPASAWDTAEHVRFGQGIAGPFEDRVVGARLPVMQPARGPRTFGHWVSAPDFSRGLLGFLTGDPVIGSLACSTLWNPEGVVDGEPFDDQAGLADQVAYVDCLDTWRMNNSHFGDFAAYHYASYHRLALIAARRYRRTHQPACRAAAYTLEGWGQHYLTDATAAGHGWNPAGSYDAGFDWQTTSALTQRMRIHDHLNESGVRMAGSAYDLGVMWGDHSSEHLAASVPELDGDPQGALTFHVSRMSLGQVVMAAECGGPVQADDVLDGGDDDDLRRIYVSDESMCDAMYGNELGTIAPDFFEDLGVDMADVLAAGGRCRADGGALDVGRDGALLARHWFQDRYYQVSPEDGWVSATIDPEAVVDPADLGCPDDLPVLPIAADARDACGTAICAIASDDGACPDGLVDDGGCCAAPPALAGAEGPVTATPWQTAPTLSAVELGSAGAVSGESAEFLWFDAIVDTFASGPPARAQGVAATLGGGRDLAGCSEQASYSVHESRLVVPPAATMADTRVALVVSALDEALRVEVDHRAVAFLSRRDLEAGPAIVPLVAQPTPHSGDGAHVVRLVHLNDCGPARPLAVRFSVTGPDPGADPDDGDPGEDPDDGGDAVSGCGCRSGGNGPGGLALALALLAVMRRRRGA
jgi:MYXO-CTERM domain-containing protein